MKPLKTDLHQTIYDLRKHVVQELGCELSCFCISCFCGLVSPNRAVISPNDLPEKYSEVLHYMIRFMEWDN